MRLSTAFSILIAFLLAASASQAATIGTFSATSQLDWHPAPNLMGTGTGSGSALLGSGGVLSIDIAETLDIFDNGAFQSNVTFTNTYQISGSLSGASLTGTSGTVTGTACQYNFGPVDLCAVWIPGITTALPAVDDPIIFDLAAAGQTSFAASNPFQTSQFTLTTVPEPTTALLLMAGMLGLMNWPRRLHD